MFIPLVFASGEAYQFDWSHKILALAGPAHAAAGALIVTEAKQDASFTLQKALAELKVARKNRSAGVGLFVSSA